MRANQNTIICGLLQHSEAEPDGRHEVAQEGDLPVLIRIVLPTRCRPLEQNTVVRTAKVCLVAALMVSIGAQYVVMQSAAWLGMAVSYTLSEGSLSKGLSQTFDGEHPCSRCKVIQKEQESEKKDESRPEAKVKLELFVMHRVLDLLPPIPDLVLGAKVPQPDTRPAVPPFRPPRTGMI